MLAEQQHFGIFTVSLAICPTRRIECNMGIMGPKHKSC